MVLCVHYIFLSPTICFYCVTFENLEKTIALEERESVARKLTLDLEQRKGLRKRDFTEP